MTKQEALNILVLIELVYPYFVIKDEAVAGWLGFCEEMDYQTVYHKFLRHIRSSPYPPSIAGMATTSGSTMAGSDCHPVFSWMLEYIPRNSPK
ncbi:replicative helicase loader/inhibitor [Mesobacillus zeae]|uniref:Uncharacterized protein n=1 Tax=Mesobacillus zeae TaxID=1917180 RepID=A0A398AWA3_9BACI|nr:replicative helicase loader/inhibitor [Mesobacillus zeae]RID81937.1 hypothetical protein D1970_20425 [Mesobacillus zeae]